MRGFVSVPLREGDLDVVGIDFEEAIRRGLVDIRNNTFTEPLTEVQYTAFSPDIGSEEKNKKKTDLLDVVYVQLMKVSIHSKW